ncbi:hypothetical protein BB560_003209, partial [Smittium megazygosporum]
MTLNGMTVRLVSNIRNPYTFKAYAQKSKSHESNIQVLSLCVSTLNGNRNK